MNRITLLLCSILLSATLFAQKRIIVNVIPADATIFEIGAGGVEKPLGNGTAQIRTERDEPVKLAFRKSGYNPIIKTYVKRKGVELPKNETFVLKDRLVKITAQPYDAKIVLNGVEAGSGQINAIIPENASVTVEVKKPGFYTKTKTYFNKQGMDTPPTDEMFVLADRALQVKLFPADAQIYVDGKKVADGSGEIVIPAKSCVTVEYVKEGFAKVERSYCNKEGMPESPLFENVTLKDRVVNVNTTPNDATIKVDGRQVAAGEYGVKILEGACVELIVEKPGFVAIVKNYCNQRNMQFPPVNDHVVLKEDEAYTSSIQSDQANVNFSISVGSGHTEEEAWKVMNQIVTNYFDVIEMSDKETGYVRTAWNMKNFPNNTIRTRIIVKPGNTGSSQYVVKIQSEASGAANTAAKDDEKFKEWGRILNTYKDIISEMQARLR